MLITRKSLMTGVVHTMDIPITEEQLDAYYAGNMMINHMFPELSDDEREFIMTGITGQEWRALVPQEDDE